LRAVDPARSRIVLFGVSEYADPGLKDVPAIANNIADLAALLTDPRIGGFNPANCIVVPPDATDKQVGKILMDAGREAEDLFLFYFVGHGLLSHRRRELYLGLSDTETDARHVMFEFSGLPFESVRSACIASPAANHAVILDCCYSGQAIPETLGPGQQDLLELIDVAGTYTLTASPWDSEAWYFPGKRHTAFTGLLLALLSKGIPGAGPLLTLDDVYGRLKSQCITEELPVPQSFKSETTGQLGLVRNRARKTSSTQKPVHDATDPGVETTQDLVLNFARSALNGFRQGAATARAARAAGYLGTSYTSHISRVDQQAHLDPHASLSPASEHPASTTSPETTAEHEHGPLPSQSHPDMIELRFAAANAATRTSYALAVIYLGLTAWVGFAPGVTPKWLILLLPGVLCAAVTGVACAASDRMRKQTSEYLLITIGNVISAVVAISIALGATTGWVAPIVVIGCIIAAHSRSMAEHLVPDKTLSEVS
jgi:hypothetical protein